MSTCEPTIEELNTSLKELLEVLKTARTEQEQLISDIKESVEYINQYFGEKKYLEHDHEPEIDL
jgi:hypothetical protein